MSQIHITKTSYLFIFLILGCLLPWPAHAKGGDTQPARGIFDPDRASRGPCDPGLQEVTGCSGSDCPGSSSRCYASLASYQQFHGCGGADQRACTGGERPTIKGAAGQACSPGFGEAGTCTEKDCNGSSSRCFASVAAYQQLQGCGGSTQRACNVWERPTINGATGQACSPGLEEVTGCAGCPSNSRCFQSLASYQQFHQCGELNQRACTVFERPTIGGVTGGACRSKELKEVQGCRDCEGSTSHCEKMTTYVRCYYKKDGKNASVDTGWEWALKKNSTDYYALEGYWHSDAPAENLFYTEQSQKDLQEICDDTLSRKKLRPAGFYAADTKNSYNYPIWTNDQGRPRDINRMIVFGDSLSDTGNLFNLTYWQLPDRTSWFLGRFSNGPVWAEYLAERLDVPQYTWAFGGATGQVVDLLKLGPARITLPVPRLDEQVESWHDYMQSAKNYFPEDTLFAVMIGANDIQDAKGSVPVLSGEVEAGLRKLIDYGARRILVLNLPDISKSPQTKYSNSANANTIHTKINEYNANLGEIVNKLGKLPSPPRMVLFDTYALVDDLLSKPDKYDLRVVDRQCLDIDWGKGTKNYLEHRPLTADCASDDAQGWVFWDGSHPSTAVHKVLADRIVKEIKPLLR